MFHLEVENGRYVPSEPANSPHFWHAVTVFATDGTPIGLKGDSRPLIERRGSIADSLDAIAPDTVRLVIIEDRDPDILEFRAELEAEDATEAMITASKTGLLGLWAAGVDVEDVRLADGRLVCGEELEIDQHIGFGDDPTSIRYQLTVSELAAYEQARAEALDFTGQAD